MAGKDSLLNGAKDLGGERQTKGNNKQNRATDGRTSKAFIWFGTNVGARGGEPVSLLRFTCFKTTQNCIVEYFRFYWHSRFVG